MNAEGSVPGIATEISSIHQMYEAQFSSVASQTTKSAFCCDRLRQRRSDLKQTVQASTQLDFSKNRARKEDRSDRMLEVSGLWEVNEGSTERFDFRTFYVDGYTQGPAASGATLGNLLNRHVLEYFGKTTEASEGFLPLKLSIWTTFAA
jgi:hypothetical protein